MRMVSWLLLVLSVICFALAIFGKLFSPQTGFFYMPVAWWRLAIGLAIYAVALPMIHGQKSAGA